MERKYTRVTCANCKTQTQTPTIPPAQIRFDGMDGWFEINYRQNHSLLEKSWWICKKPECLRSLPNIITKQQKERDFTYRPKEIITEWECDVCGNKAAYDECNQMIGGGLIFAGWTKVNYTPICGRYENKRGEGVWHTCDPMCKEILMQRLTAETMERRPDKDNTPLFEIIITPEGLAVKPTSEPA